MPFGRFLCEVDMNTILHCDACGAALRGSRVGYVVFGFLGFLFAVGGGVVIRLTLADPTGASLMVLALAFVAAPPSFLLLGNFIAWRFVPWKQVERQASRSIAET